MPPRPRASLVLCALLALTLAPAAKPPAPVDAQSASLREKGAQLDSIKAELQRGRTRLKALQKQEGSHLDQIEQLQNNIRTSQQYLEAMARQIDSVDAQIHRLESAVSVAAGRLADRRSKMERRLRSMYLADPMLRPDQVRMIDLVLASRSVEEALYRIRHFQDINRYDQMLLHQIDSAKTDLSTRKRQVEARRTELASLKQDKQQEQMRLTDEQTEHRKGLEGIRAEKAAYLTMIKQLEASQRQLSAIIKSLMVKKKTEKQPVAVRPTAPDRRKGSLPWPVRGTVVQEFGKVIHPVYKTITMNNGIDISGSPGQAVQCVASGKVIYVGTMRGLGTFLMMEHANSLLTIYANLEDVSVKTGQQLTSGSSLGRIGHAAAGGEARLHFEIRRLADPMNPRDWLE